MSWSAIGTAGRASPTRAVPTSTPLADQHSGIANGVRASERAYVYRILRRLDLAALIQAAMRQRTLRGTDSEGYAARPDESSAPITGRGRGSGTGT